MKGQKPHVLSGAFKSYIGEISQTFIFRDEYRKINRFDTLCFEIYLYVQFGNIPQLSRSDPMR